MKNFIQPGETLKFTAPSGGVVSGGAYKIGALVVVAVADAAEAAAFEGVVKGVFEVTKVSAQAWTEGAKIYWDDTAKKFTTVSTSNTLVGIAADAAANPSSTGKLVLQGTPSDPGQSGVSGAPQVFDDLTENGGAIGGTSDGDAPSLTATAAALTGTLTGTTNGALVDIAATAAACAGGADPTAAQVDTAIALAVSTIVSGANEQNKELLEAVNKLTADNVALRAALREALTGINGLNAALAAMGLTEPS